MGERHLLLIHPSSLMQVEEEHRGKQAAINPLRLIRLSNPT